MKLKNFVGIGLISLVASGGGLSITSCSKNDNYDLYDLTIHFKDVPNWHSSFYRNYLSKHKPKNFIDTTKESTDVLNYFNENLKPGDMLNSFIQYFYFCAESIDFYSNADLTAPIDFFDCVDQYSMFHVQYIKQDSSGHFSFWILLDFAFDRNVWVDYNGAQEIQQNTETTIQVHSNTHSTTRFLWFMKNISPDQSLQQWPGNVFNMTVEDGSGFVIDATESFFATTFTKINWGYIPIIGFDDVNLPTS